MHRNSESIVPAEKVQKCNHEISSTSQKDAHTGTVRENPVFILVYAYNRIHIEKKTSQVFNCTFVLSQLQLGCRCTIERIKYISKTKSGKSYTQKAWV